MNLKMTVLVPALFFLSVGTVSSDDGERDDLQIGEVAPELNHLPGIDGQPHSTGDFAQTHIQVLSLQCNHCPYAVDYEDRLNALQNTWKDKKSVRLIAINSNHGRDETPDKMRERATEKKFEFLYLKDETQEFARSMSAVYTPEFFVLDRDRKLVYKGALDDSTDAGGVTEKHVETAVTAVLSGKPVDVKQVGARGCTIRFRRRK